MKTTNNSNCNNKNTLGGVLPAIVLFFFGVCGKDQTFVH
jgi:hypothetical protein